MPRIIIVGEIPRRVLAALLGGYDVHVLAQVGPEEAVSEWGKALLGSGAYRAIVAGRGVPDRLGEVLEQLAERQGVALVRHVTGRDVQALAQDLGASAVKAVPSFVISFNNKGGTGKSTLAANAAVRVAEAGARVLVVDDDVQNGDAAGYFGLSDSIPHLGDLLERQDGRLGPQDVQAVISATGYGVDVLAAPPTPTGAGLTVPVAWELAMALTELPYDVVFVDAPPGLTQGTLTQALLQEGLVSMALLPFSDDDAGRKGLREARTLILEQVDPKRVLAVLMRIRPDVLAEPGQMPELQGLEVLEIPYYAGLVRNPILYLDGGGGLKTFLGAFLGRAESEAAVAFESLGRRLVQVLTDVAESS